MWNQIIQAWHFTTIISHVFLWWIFSPLSTIIDLQLGTISTFLSSNYLLFLYHIVKQLSLLIIIARWIEALGEAIADNDEQIVIMGTSQENILSKKMFSWMTEPGHQEHLLALSFKLEQFTTVLSVHSHTNDDEYVYNKTFYFIRF